MFEETGARNVNTVILPFSCVQDELMAELEELEQEELNKKMTNVRLPDVPSTSRPAQPASMPGRRPGAATSAQRPRPGASTLTACGPAGAQTTASPVPFSAEFPFHQYIPFIRSLCLCCMLKASRSTVANFYLFYVLASSRRAEEDDEGMKQLAAWAS